MPVLLNSVKARQSGDSELKIIAGNQQQERKTYPASACINVNNRGEMIEAPAEAVGYSVFLTNGATKNIIANYSSAATDFSLAPAADEMIFVSIICVHIVDDNVGVGKFGGLGALTTGINFKIKAGAATVMDIFDGEPVKTNEDFDMHCATFNQALSGVGIKGFIGAKINVREIFNRPIRLDGALSMSLVYTVEDDFTGIDKHFVKAIGYKLDLNDL
jgi:hypothetical protein